VRAWLRRHRRALLRALGKLGAQKSASVFNALVIGVALSLPAGGYALLNNLGGVAGRISAEPRISIFMRVGAARSEGQALAAQLKADARIAELRFVPREEALAELRATHELAGLLKELDRNPLPDALVLRASDPSAASLEGLAAELRALPGVEHVQLDAAWARRLAALGGVVRWGLAVLAALLSFGLVAITFNTIRLQILTQRDEIMVAKLIGATDAYVRRPFLYLGATQGLAGGALALAAVWIGLALLNGQVRPLAASYGSEFRLAFLEFGDSVSILAFSGILGWVGAWLSVSRHLRHM
jgi:cell division transport system permease protein